MFATFDPGSERLHLELHPIWYHLAPSSRAPDVSQSSYLDSHLKRYSRFAVGSDGGVTDSSVCAGWIGHHQPERTVREMRTSN
jgi:hypothetical protein